MATKKSRNRNRVLSSTLLALSAATTHAFEGPDDLFDLSIEELVNLEVTSVSRKPESLANTSSAVYVITRDDIERHGIRSIPEALRLAPGISVQQIDANKWSVGSRGLTGRFANNLLVMMDGRLLYTPSFSGVYWDVQSTLIEEIERIEVIRGPGAVVWGTNAVNGVINIITAKSGGTRGGDVLGGLNPEGGNFTGIRYSDSLSDTASYRVFAHYSEGDANKLPDGNDANDEWDVLRLSFRSDWSSDSSEYAATLEGYEGNYGTTRRFYEQLPPFQRLEATVSDVSGVFGLFDWSRSSEDGANINGQFYVDHSERTDVLWSEDRSTYSADLQYRRQFGRHHVSVGGALRISEFDFRSSTQLEFFDGYDTNRVVSAFVQDEFWLSEDTVSITAGLKLESNDYSPESVEWMPSLRVLWKPAEQHTVWGAVTRAVRAPSVSDLATRILDLGPPIPPLSGINPFPLVIRPGTIGNPDFDSVPSVSIEAGIRGQLGTKVSYDLALFTVDYDGVRSLTLTDPICVPSGTVVTNDPSCLLTSSELYGLAIFTNNNDAWSNGGELSVDWQVLDNLRIRTSVSVANEQTQTSDPLTVSAGSVYPNTQANMQVLWSPRDNVSVATWVRYTDRIEAAGVDDFWQANLNIRWRIENRWIASFGIRNALEDDNVESRSDINEMSRISIERTVFANVRYSF